MATALISTEFIQLVNYIKSYYGAGSDAFQMAQELLGNPSLVSTGTYDLLANTPGVEIWRNEYGIINGYSIPSNFKTSSPISAGSLPNSNVTGSLGTGGSKVVKFPGTYHASGGMMSGLKNAAGKAMTVATWVSAGCAAVSAGISLGKTLNRAIYNINPNYWDENLPSMNPDTWGQIVSGNDLASKAFRFIFKVDENSDGTTAYMDENAVAYMAKYMALNDFFDDEEIDSTNVQNNRIYYTDRTPYDVYLRGATDYPIKYTTSNIFNVGSMHIEIIPSGTEPVYTSVFRSPHFVSGSQRYWTYTFINASKEDYSGTITAGSTTYNLIGFPCHIDGIDSDFYYDSTNIYVVYPSNPNPLCTDDRLIIYGSNGATTSIFSNESPDIPGTHDFTKNVSLIRCVAAMVLFGERTSPVEGVGTQPGATTPELNPDDTLFDILEALKLQFPEMWADPLIDDVPQPDGSVVQFRYVPVTVPDFTPEGYPITGTKLQTDPLIDPVVDPDPYPTISYNFITNPSPSPAPVPNPLQSIVNVPSVDPDPQPDPSPLPENVPEVDPAPDTGTGTTPIIPPQSGTASALFQIYNPTLAEINSFGQWLWSTDLFDQLQKLFQNPIDAVIGLHKIYATPSTGATSTIKLGFLDSGVSSKLVTSQYVNVSCGSVDILETFQSVFDYAPYTSASLYLPFIGIVDLDINEIMRGTVSIIYNIDVLTGACLAQVTVTRDNAGGVLYTYTGNCAVQLPITSGSYQGIIQGLVSIAGIAATGGSAAPLAIAGAATHMSASVSHSGSISSNAGAMGIKTPYIVLSRPQVAMPGNYESIQGIPSNSRCTLSECSGYVKVKDVFSRSSTATSEEQELIEGLLKEGVYIS